MKKIFVIFALSLSTFLVGSSQNVNVVLRSNLPYTGQTCANLWGYNDASGNEYALVGASKGMSIVDITNPASPVEVAQIPNIDNLWKEIRTYRKYAYVTTEADTGLQIVDLSNLPGTTLPYKHWRGDGAIAGQIKNIHALHIDTANARLYLYGGNMSGAVIVDISDPWNPTYLGKYSANYVHDGFARNDTLWAGEIYQGRVNVLDVSNPASISSIGIQQTPGSFTHNTWLTDDGKTMFTTDEVDSSYVTAYDVSDLSNIVELDRIQSNPGSGSIVHNTYYNNGYAITSWYKDGFTIVDAHRPNNLVQVGNYDTDPAESGSGYGGAWGVYAYLPSGNIIVSNIYNGEGLFVLTPTYVRAAYLEGTITDAANSNPLSNVSVQITSPSILDNSRVDGTYGTGIAGSGTVDVTYSLAGYFPQTFTNISLTAGAVTTQDVQLVSTTGIKENSNTSVSIYPNPTKDKFQVLGLKSKVEKVEIYNIIGEIIFNLTIQQSNNLTIDLSNQPNGVYLLKMTDEQGSISYSKIVKE